MANQLILGRALDANGYIAPGAKATIYADGTSTLITVYSDIDGSMAATNPIIADGDGFWPQRYVTENAKAVVTTSADVALYTLDPAPAALGGGGAASAISFSPTLDLPQTNVQAAIEAAADLAVSGFAAFGLGITGNAELLANLDATGTSAGVYRFDGTTTGTFPTGVAAGDTGMIELWRQAGATAMMELHHATSNRVFRRRLTSSTWGAWREEINVDQATAEGDTVYRGASDFTRLPKGTGGQFLRMNAGATAPEWSSGWTYTSPATLSGTSQDWGSLPAGITEVDIFLSVVSMSGTDALEVRLGNSGGFVSSGYVGTSAAINNTATSSTAFSTGFSVGANTAGDQLTGVLHLYKGDSDIWYFDCSAARNTARISISGGALDLAGVLTQIRIRPDGANSFDAGTAYIRYR